MKTQKKEKTPQKILKNDLKKFNQDCAEISKHRKLAQNKKFLGKVAHDIRELINDALAMEKNTNLKPVAQLIRHMLMTPFGAPFVSQKTLFEAALAFKYQDPLQSDLCDLMENFAQYNLQFNSEMETIFTSLWEAIPSEV